MKKLTLFFIIVFVLNTGAGKIFAQCSTGNCLVNQTGKPDNEVWIECFNSSSCNKACKDTCVLFKFENLYHSKNIKEIDVFCDDIAAGTFYSLCDYYRLSDNQSWTVSYNTDDDFAVPPPMPQPCEEVSDKSDGLGDITWSVTAPTGGTIGYGDWLYVDYCGHACDKCDWTIHFSDGTSCDVSMSCIGGTCCNGDNF